MRIKILLRYERFRNFTEKCGSRKYALHEKQMIRIEVNFLLRNIHLYNQWQTGVQKTFENISKKTPLSKLFY